MRSQQVTALRWAGRILGRIAIAVLAAAAVLLAVAAAIVLSGAGHVNPGG